MLVLKWVVGYGCGVDYVWFYDKGVVVDVVFILNFFKGD